MEIKDRHVHCYYVRTLYKTIAIRAAFVIYAWHLVAWHLEQQPNIHVDLMDRTWNHLVNKIEDKIYILTKKGGENGFEMHNLVLYTMGKLLDQSI